LKSLFEIKDDCYLVLDTNVLLLPYTINSKSLKEIKDTYLQLVNANRLFIPGQVAREFANNRAKKIAEIHQQLSKKRNAQGLNKLESYPLLDSVGNFQEAQEIFAKIEELTKDYRKRIGEVLNQIKSWAWNDPVSLAYRDLFRNDVIFDLVIDDVQKKHIEEDLQSRVIHSIPPGYKDSYKVDKGIGDLLIWKTILEIGKKHCKNIIFVSNDEKSDWWYQSENEALYPRYELIDEFRRASNQQSFHIVTFSRFLELYGASQEVVKEVEEKEIESWQNSRDQEIKKGLGQILIESIGGKLLTLEEAIQSFEIDPIIEIFGTWAVTDYGLECLSTEYPIEKNRLTELDWVSHMKTKTWVKIFDFIAALEFARKYHSIKTL
jgi:rRNA-processing protein FCF1